MITHILIRPDEDGNPIRWLTDADVQDLFANPLEWGVMRFLTNPKEKDANYWQEGDAMLIKIEILKPVIEIIQEC